MQHRTHRIGKYSDGAFSDAVQGGMVRDGSIELDAGFLTNQPVHSLNYSMHWGIRANPTSL